MLASQLGIRKPNKKNRVKIDALTIILKKNENWEMGNVFKKCNITEGDKAQMA